MFCDVLRLFVTFCDVLWRFVTFCDVLWRFVTFCDVFARASVAGHQDRRPATLFIPLRGATLGTPKGGCAQGVCTGSVRVKNGSHAQAKSKFRPAEVSCLRAKLHISSARCIFWAVDPSSSLQNFIFPLRGAIFWAVDPSS